MSKREEFRKLISEAAGFIRRAVIAEHGNVYFGFGNKFYERPQYILGWLRHPDPDKRVYEVKYVPSWGVTCDLCRGSNGAADDVAMLVPEGYVWEENPNLFEEIYV